MGQIKQQQNNKGHGAGVVWRRAENRTSTAKTHQRRLVKLWVEICQSRCEW
jgi:hypothetical protein